MATPIIADVRKKWPEATLTAMCQGAIGSLLRGNPYLNEIFSFTRPNQFLRKEERRDLIERLRQGKYDLGIALPHSFSSAWWLWRGHVKYRVGYRANGRGFLLNRAIRFPKTRGQEHLVTTYKRLLEPLGIPLSNTSPELFVQEEERETRDTW